MCYIYDFCRMFLQLFIYNLLGVCSASCARCTAPLNVFSSFDTTEKRPAFLVLLSKNVGFLFAVPFIICARAFSRVCNGVRACNKSRTYSTEHDFNRAMSLRQNLFDVRKCLLANLVRTYVRPRVLVKYCGFAK